MVAVVIGKLSQRQIRVPTPSEVQHTCPKHVLERLNRPITLSVRLWVVSGTEMQPNTQLLMELLPEPGSEMYI